ncbi:MAG: ABC transporter permease subunit, partial [Xanthomonadaceae bacterium]|nr:ABC transporter permease subunit [Xanthomonadaceae bacterium]
MRLQSSFLEICRFEWRQQLKAPLFWVIAAVFGALAFALVSTDAVTVGGASGNVLRNAPLVIVRLLTVLSVLSMFLVTVFVAGAALRDFEQRTAELVFTTPISRGAYLGGRFAAGYLAALAIMLVCALGIALGGMMPWIDAARLGPASWHGYAWAFGVMVMPDMLFIAALLFLLATTTRSLLATYVGLIVFFVLQAVVGQLSKDVNNHYVAALLDPFGGRTVALVTRYWSAYQANRELPALGGVLLFNRLLWTGMSLAMLGATLALFRPNREGLQLPRRKRRAEPPMLRPSAGTAALALPKVRLADNLRAHLLQLRAQFAFDTLGVLRGVPFLIMLVLGVANLFGSLLLSGQIYGTATYPVTHQVLEMLRGAFQWLLFIIITFYAGELVWRERSQRSAEVSDAFPLPDWIPLVAKLGALLAVIAAFQLVGALVGIGWQLGHGYTHLEPGLYLATLALNAM